MFQSVLDAVALLVGNPYYLVLVVGSVAAGNLLGVLPGLGVIFGIVVLLPFTLQLPPEIGVVTLMGIFVGAATGGGLTAALIGIPGTPMAVATLLDAHPMAKQGRTGEALGLVVIASVVGGLFSAFVLAFLSPLLAKVALGFGPPEYVLLVGLGLLTIAYISRGSVMKGLLAGLFGLAIATVGTDLATAQLRFTFGVSSLSGGFSLIPVLLGLFAIPEIVALVERGQSAVVLPREAIRPCWPSWSHWRESWRAYLRSSSIGTAVGALPGAGADIASFLAYAQEKRASRNPERLGKGDPNGVIASEAANNAVTGGALIPTLTLGIPGDAATAILVGVLYMHGLAPGPDLYTQKTDLIAFIYVGLFFANLVMLLLGMYALRPFLAFLRLPHGFMVPAILLLCVLGVWSIQTSIFDLWTMAAFGVLGLFLRKMEVPLSPVILGFILGPLLEQNLRRALAMSDGSPLIFLTRPYCLAILALLALALWGVYAGLKRLRAGAVDTAG
ncbi:MAG: tripartite tricarboxylate transporter permease [Betaproteobacteria bacterium]